MRILGIDAATHRVGFAILEDDKLITSGTWRLVPTKAPLYIRLTNLWGRLEALQDVLLIDVVACEHPFVNPRARLDTAIRLGCAVGVVMGWAILYGLDFVLIAPTSAKKAATGNGTASKLMVQEAVKQRYGLDSIEENAADAVGVALAAQEKFNEQESG